MAKSLTKADIAALISEACNAQTATLLQKMGEKFDSLETKFVSCNTKLSEHDEQISILEDKVNQLEQQNKLVNLRFYGIPESTDGVSLKAVIVKFCLDKLTVQVENKDIIGCYRIGKVATNGTQNNKPRVVLVRFANVDMKMRIFNSKRNLKKSPFRLSEDLTPVNYGLYKDCLATYGPKNTWTMNHVIFVEDKDGKKVAVKKTLTVPEVMPEDGRHVTQRRRR